MAIKYLCTLQFSSTQSYEENLQTLVTLINETPENSLVLAPEVCLTGFDYENFEVAAAFSAKAIETLLKLTQTRTIVLTLIEKQANRKFFNVAKVLHNGKIIHEQAKNKLFKLGDEHKHFSEGRDEHFKLFEVDGSKLGLMICFEMRFKNYWQDLEGADIILVPSRWGKNRTENFKVITEALAIINQCYVLGADASNEDCTRMSGIITPFGKAARNGNKLCLITPYNKDEIRKMRRYLDVGI